jgi:hypothetical protein
LVPEEGSSITYSIPEDVKKYILYFRDVIRDGSAYEIPVLYSE